MSADAKQLNEDFPEGHFPEGHFPEGHFPEGHFPEGHFPDDPLSQATKECEKKFEEIEKNKKKLETEGGPLGQEASDKGKKLEKLEHDINDLKAKSNQSKPDLWERLLFHHKVLNAVLGVYVTSELKGQKVPNDMYYMQIGMALQPKKGFMITDYTAKQAIGEFIESNGEEPNDPNKLTQAQVIAYTTIGKKLMEGGIDNLLKNDEYKGHINEIKEKLNSDVAKAILKDLLSSFMPKAEINKMNGSELYARAVAGLSGLGEKGVEAAGAAFDKYDAGEAGKLIKKSLGGLIL